MYVCCVYFGGVFYHSWVGRLRMCLVCVVRMVYQCVKTLVSVIAITFFYGFNFPTVNLFFIFIPKLFYFTDYYKIISVWLPKFITWVALIWFGFLSFDLGGFDVLPHSNNCGLCFLDALLVHWIILSSYYI